jgi:hypothetical protein
VPYECPLYEFYFGLIGGILGIAARKELQRDTVISFNYDLVVEHALHEVNIPFSYGLSTRQANFDASAQCQHEYGSNETVRLLKIHGSVNWALDNPNELPTLYGTYENLREHGLSPLLIPPTWRKGFGPQLVPVWDAAVAELRTATRIIVLGYSIPPTDLHFKYLLAAGLQDNISLRKLIFVNPGAETLKPRLFDIVRPEHEARGIVTFVPDKASAFFMSHYRQDIGRETSTGINVYPL